MHMWHGEHLCLMKIEVIIFYRKIIELIGAGVGYIHTQKTNFTTCIESKEKYSTTLRAEMERRKEKKKKMFSKYNNVVDDKKQTKKYAKHLWLLLNFQTIQNEKWISTTSHTERKVCS